MHDSTPDAEDTASREAPKGINAWAIPIMKPVPPSVGGDGIVVVGEGSGVCSVHTEDAISWSILIK